MAATTRRKAPSRPWGRGAIMQPTPRGSGVWVGEQKDTRARRQAAHIRNTAGRAILLPPERKLRRANSPAVLAFAIAMKEVVSTNDRRSLRSVDVHRLPRRSLSSAERRNPAWGSTERLASPEGFICPFFEAARRIREQPVVTSAERKLNLKSAREIEEIYDRCITDKVHDDAHKAGLRP